ncbi:hypothetical protein [Paenibacillus taichungensis]
MPFERPTEHYDERIYKIDEQICEMLKLRKQLSNNNPGFPPFEYIYKWAETFELYEDFLKIVFGTLRSEEHYKPMVGPSDFRKHVPVLMSVEEGNFFYTLNSIRQYSNASVVTFNIDWDEAEVPSIQNGLHHFELQIGEEYDCRMVKGGGHSVTRRREQRLSLGWNSFIEHRLGYPETIVIKPKETADQQDRRLYSTTGQ